ncbi:hypothetical protein HDU83_000742 [Entophlyctis luteolus]|nr:hypothetical protein HDU83_000742 [Entophlyctis luteolus]
MDSASAAVSSQTASVLSQTYPTFQALGPSGVFTAGTASQKERDRDRDSGSVSVKDSAAEKELRLLRARISELTKENAVLKKSLFDLSLKFNAFVQSAAAAPVASGPKQSNQKPQSFCFDLDGLDDESMLIDSLVGEFYPTSNQSNASNMGTSTNSPAFALGGGSRFNIANGSSAGPVNDGGAKTVSAGGDSNQLQTAQPPLSTSASPPSMGSIANVLKKNAESILDLGDPEFKAPSNLRESRTFYLKHEFKGHAGAVYVVKFSPCGKFVASGSFDKTVRMWENPISAASQGRETIVFKRHSLNVSDLAWSNDSALLLSGVPHMSFSSNTDESRDKSQFYFGTTRNVLGFSDRRHPGGAVSTILNDAMVNSIHVYRDNSYVMTADSNGFLKTWDVRAGEGVVLVPKCAD